MTNNANNFIFLRPIKNSSVEGYGGVIMVIGYGTVKKTKTMMVKCTPSSSTTSTMYLKP